MPLVTFALGVITILLSLTLPGNVFSIAVDSLSKIGAGVAGAVLVKALGWRHSGFSLLMSIVAGVSAAFVWKYLGYASVMNEAGIGMGCSLAANWLFSLLGGAKRTVVATR